MISIILPIYNAGKYLRPALESVRAQTLKDFECICINDGSIDNSSNVVREFMACDKRFKLIEQKNSGVSVARNAGLDAARGEFICFLDQDDLYAPDYLEHLHDMITTHDADLSRVQSVKVNDDFELAPTTIPQSANIKFYDKNPEKLFMSISGWMHIWVCMFRASAIKNIRFPVELPNGGEDIVFMMCVVDDIKNVVQSNAKKYIRRRSAISTMFQNRKKLNPRLLLNFLHRIPLVHAHCLMANNPKWAEYVYTYVMRRMFKTLVRDTLRKNQQRDVGREVLSQIIKMPSYRPEYLRMHQRLILKIFMWGKK